MNTLLATTAIVMAGTFPAFAEQHSMSGPFVDSSAMETTADLRASRLIGMSVYSTEDEVGDEGMVDAGDNWERIGEINDVILSRSGDMEAVLLDIGGFLGIGERTVAVNLSDLKLVSDTDAAGDFFVVVNSNRETLENAPEFDTDLIGAWNAAERSGENADDMAEETTEQTAAAVEGAATEAGENAEGAVVATGAALNEAGDEVAEAGDEVAESAEAAGQEMEQEADEMAAETDGEMAVETETEMAAETDGEIIDGMTYSPEGYMAVDATTMTAEQIDGAAVYDGRDERVGEISEVIVSEDGKISNVILDVGGFLGIGEKHVSMPFDQLNLQQEDGGDDLRVYVAATKEELEAMEDYEK
ncbi:PRC-barrel domain-containing protein [Primorskyibacter flagellatus]|uniref:PRC-barrel domain-containing protein n=1 Tax=Primorskyibacter flagellatus TaxID=1387277 RepID=A0A1W1ZSQ0_9RHOB|nr:PRC-barrel domain-containing protein [Primorskyibacter flagellatus]SMC51404.1 PRC-barrel domain-containing protein [Primorskyibacter flagellatus]